MAAQIAAQAPPRLLAGATLVPVPLHPARRRTRGFDQTRLLTEAVGRRAGRPVAACLRRGGPATRQLGARRARRLLPGRIVVSLGEPAPELAALVDDVHTTGATLDACARVLRAGGAREVVCLTYARALRR
jgi:predicted amidophosphoribosyltransferase